MTMKEELKSFLEILGVLSVTMTGTLMMLQLYAISLDMDMLRKLLEKLLSVQAQAQYGWMM